MKLKENLEKFGGYVLGLGISLLFFINDFSTIIPQNLNDFFSKFLIGILIIIAIGGLLQFLSGFFEESKTLRNFYICDVFRQITVILGFFSLIVGIVALIGEMVYYIEYKRVLTAYSKIPILVIISFIGWFFLKNSYRFDNMELIKFAFRNRDNIKFDIKLSSKGFFCWNKEIEIKTIIKDLILRIYIDSDSKSNLKNINITAQLLYDLSFNFCVKPIKYANKGNFVSQNNYIVESESEDVKKAFETMILKYGENFVFKYEKGFRLLKNISKNHVFLVLEIPDFSVQKDENNILNYINQLVEYLDSIKKLN